MRKILEKRTKKPHSTHNKTKNLEVSRHTISRSEILTKLSSNFLYSDEMGIIGQGYEDEDMGLVLLIVLHYYN